MVEKICIAWDPTCSHLFPISHQGSSSSPKNLHPTSCTKEVSPVSHYIPNKTHCILNYMCILLYSRSHYIIIPFYSQQNPLYTKLYVYLIIFSLYHYPILFPLVSLGYFHTKSLFWDTCFMIFPDISFFVSLRFPKQSGNINRKYLEVGNSMVPDTLW